MAKILFALLTIALIVGPLVRFKDAIYEMNRECQLKDRNEDCDMEENVLIYKLTRDLDDGCDYRQVYTICISARCAYRPQIIDAINDLNNVCDAYGASTPTIDDTTTTAAPVAPKDQLAKIIVGVDCKYACDTEKRAVYDEIMKTGNNKVACSKLRPYTDCLRSECATPVADTIITSMKDLCYEDASPHARGLSGLMLKLSANLYLE